MELFSARQRTLFPDAPPNASPDQRSGAFVDNMRLPVHRWFRYSAGFSAEWVRSVLRSRCAVPSEFCVLDPFAGVGTTLLACDATGIVSHGFEPHPFVFRVARAKIRGIHVKPRKLVSLFERFASSIPQDVSVELSSVAPLLRKCYTPDVLATLLAMRDLFLSQYDEKTPESELLWLAITSMLRSTSGVGTAQWQYVLPKKRKSGSQLPESAFRQRANEFLEDIEFAQSHKWQPVSQIWITDARCPEVPQSLSVDAVLTSPPYPNNYDYADATRLEMTFWGEVASWGDLQHAVRRHLIRSCSQHSAAEKLALDELLSDSHLDPIRPELTAACRQLEEIRESKGGRKTYHTMAAAYFTDLALVFRALRPVCRTGSFLCFVIGDSAPYGVYLSVDQWLGRLAVAAGFRSFCFEKIRDRNVKWKNRKHRVPLKEGRLWIEG